MIANAFGHDLDLNKMRQRFSSSSRGVNLRNLIHYAAALDLSARALKVRPDDMDLVALPAILHWEGKHFVVLEKLSKKFASIVDPGRGRIKLPRKELFSHTNGVLLEFSKATEFTPQSDRNKINLRDLFGGIRGLKRSLWQIVFLTVIIQAITILTPLYIQLVVDEAIIDADQNLLLVLALAFGALALLNSISEYVRNWVVLVLAQNLSFQMIANVVRHLLRLKTEFFERRHIGDILSRISSLQPIRQAFTQTSISVIVDGLMALSLIVVMATYSFLLTSAALVLTGILVLCSQIIIYFMRKRQLQQLVDAANEQTHLLETIRSTRAIKIFGREVEREEGWRELYSRMMNSNIQLGNLQHINSLAISSMIGIQSVILVFLGAQLVIDATLTLGMLFAFLAYQANFSNCLFAQKKFSAFYEKDPSKQLVISAQ